MSVGGRRYTPFSLLARFFREAFFEKPLQTRFNPGAGRVFFPKRSSKRMIQTFERRWTAGRGHPWGGTLGTTETQHA